MNQSQLTTKIRDNIRQARRNLSKAQREKGQESIYRQVKCHPKIESANHLAIFLSFDGELNTQPIIDYLWKHKKSVFIPIIHPFNRKHLLFLRYHEQTILIRNKWGILEPKLNVNDVIPHQKLDVIFTPLVAFDERNYRIGMGGGYYDRLLENYLKDNIYPIGLAFKCQQIADLPNQPWDVKLPEIISA